ncbi:MAG: electron transfer flavoprotein subunit alpha/FixB family protein [Bacteroidales bacterium]|jgi:electron transfer flavoprotein alpha subunit|nr:electron transfer flavoprotein subunit alpha/FixB family protein [Bacteroidales bacterium]
MNSIFVYCEITEDGAVADVSLELLSKGRELADTLQTKLEVAVFGSGLSGVESVLFAHGADVLHVADNKCMFPYRTLPHFSVLVHLFEQEHPEIALFGATSIGRDLAPRVASRLSCGLTADCTALEIGNHTESKTGKEYHNLLLQVRPAFGGNIIATIINPETRPQMATVREGVMKRVISRPQNYVGTVKYINVSQCLTDTDNLVEILNREIEACKINIKGARVIVSGGYGMGNKENFSLLHELAALLGGEVGATRAAVDAGLAEHERQIGQTGVTVRPKLYVACGISGAVQHRAGMEESAKIISINTDINAPINAIADYTIIADAKEVVEKMIKELKNGKIIA